MAPRLIPQQPDFASEAERAVWTALKRDLPPEALLAANVHLHCHEDFYEADLVVGLPGQGFVVVEVKGGHVWREDGRWWQQTGDGPRPIDPAVQADRAKRLLDQYARQRGWSRGPIRFEHMVAFPDTRFGPEPPSPDVPRWALLAQGDLDGAAGRVWDALNHRATGIRPPSAADVAEMADILGGRPDPAALLLGRAQAREDHVRQLTQQQYGVLRAFRKNACVYASGGPGTGKTWLALERARQWAQEGKQVLLVCYSRGLSRWLSAAVAAYPEPVARRVHVQTFGQLGLSWGIDVPDEPTHEWWTVALPELMAHRAAPAYDALVVDEAQDFADSWWPPLLAALRHRTVFIAGDEQQSVFAGRRGRPDLPLVELALDENLRNTTQIAAVFNPLAADRMVFRGGDGPPVRYVEAATEDAVDAADREVDRLLGSGCPAGSIALLTTRSRHPLHREAEAQLGKDGYWDGFWMDDEVFYGTVMGFKGLERPVVVLAVDGFHDGVARDVVYSGLSRARDELVVVGDREVLRAAAGEEVARRITGR